MFFVKFSFSDSLHIFLPLILCLVKIFLLNFIIFLIEFSFWLNCSNIQMKSFYLRTPSSPSPFYPAKLAQHILQYYGQRMPRQAENPKGRAWWISGTGGASIEYRISRGYSLSIAAQFDDSTRVVERLMLGVSHFLAD